jgi:hypothetical protein
MVTQWPMMHKEAAYGGSSTNIVAVVGLFVLAYGGLLPAQAEPPVNVSVDWSHTIAVSKTSPTLMMEVHPLLREGHALNAPAFAAFKELGAHYVRYHGQSMWPRLVVAELEPPTRDKTFWDFSAMNSIVVPFFEATRGHEPVLNLNTIPAWMFKTDEAVHHPDNPDQYGGDYAQGTELVDPSGRQLADYYARVVSWYTQGGFTDELGSFHASRHHYELPWWGVLPNTRQRRSSSRSATTPLYRPSIRSVRGPNSSVSP